MIYRLIRWILHKFDYELVSFAMMADIKRKIDKLHSIADGRCQLSYTVDYCNGEYFVVATGYPVLIVVKRFKVSDYGSIDYARACAEELCEKLNERP